MVVFAAMSETDTPVPSPVPTGSPFPVVHVERVLPRSASLTVGEVDAILEAAYLATAADGHLSSEEHEAFRTVASALRQIASGGTSWNPKVISDKDLDSLFLRFAVRSDHAERAVRDGAVGAGIGPHGGDAAAEPDCVSRHLHPFTVVIRPSRLPV